MRWLALTVLLCSAPAYATAPCTKQIYTDLKKEPNYSCPGPGEDSLVPRLQLKTSVELKVKKPAPWPGILMDKNRVMTLGLRIKALRRIRWQETIGWQEKLENEKKFQAAMYQATLNLRTSQRDNYKSQTKALQEEVIRLNKWYRSPTFWFATGFVVASAGATALAFGLRK
jgi:hypothetical protein